jgi:hypothetical protein
MRIFTILTVFSILSTLANPPCVSSREARVPTNGANKLVKVMPVSALPSPRDFTLEHVILGIGTQNITCMDGDEDEMTGTSGVFGKKPFVCASIVGLNY